VTVDALLNSRVLTVTNGRRSRVALQAKRVRACACQHSRVGGTVREVTGRASLHFYRFVLKHKWPAFIAVALEANHVLIRSRAKLAIPHCPVCVVAIGALNQPLFHAMMEWLLEIGSLFDVAGEAKRRLILDELIFQL